MLFIKNTLIRQEGRTIKKQFIKNGYVDVKLTGKQLDKLLNYLSQRDIPFYNLRKINSTEIKLRMRYTDAFHLRSIRKQFKFNFSFDKRGGMPYYYQKRRKWMPFLLSLLFTIGLIFILSNMVWKIEISGGSPEVRYEVDELIGDLGMNRGSFMQSMESISSIEREIMNKVEEVSYVGIKRTGTSFYIMIEENDHNNINEDRLPSNLVATNSGTVQKVYITNGRPLVQVNDVVRKGDVLVTGRLDDENDVYTYSEGEVLAEVWYNITGTIDLSQEKRDLIDDVQHHYSLGIGNRDISINEPDELRLLLEEEKPIYFLFWKTPLNIQKKYYYEEGEITETIDEEIIDQVIEEQLKRKLGQSVEVISQNVLHLDKDSDKVKIEMFVKVMEDITKEEIIDQGD
ncbi:sporulation protein YqfD [Aquisalibacillus elongatus]|uniref:Sporulation protein YqfD n=1 Tax=Aquisalibacillus elongatus TaxID=485577 RepID=A0A3N5BD70_9BACI|nr:sporulation protein YqfD [Aquisalibacillus elongatus]RPF55594.1 sporulation protein YqfD [Aquisalibacillus elongatus]